MINLVAEIGCCHLGDMQRAKSLISMAAWSGADYVKLQKRNPVESTPKELQDKPHPNQAFAYGETYLQHRINLELTIDQHAELMSYAKDHGIKYVTSVWDITSAREVISLNPEYIKVPSACNTNTELLQVLLNDFSGGVHVSTGMTTTDELWSLEKFIRNNDPDDRVVVYHCTSEYPCPHEHLYLKNIPDIVSQFKPRAVGFSNHGYGIAMDPIAFVLGATWVERHFIDDRTIRHTDAAASLEPDGFRKLSRDLKAAELAFQRREAGLSEEESRQRDKLKFRGQ